jgi:hypothetical protein
MGYVGKKMEMDFEITNTPQSFYWIALFLADELLYRSIGIHLLPIYYIKKKYYSFYKIIL